MPGKKVFHADSFFSYLEEAGIVTLVSRGDSWYEGTLQIKKWGLEPPTQVYLTMDGPHKLNILSASVTDVNAFLENNEDTENEDDLWWEPLTPVSDPPKYQDFVTAQTKQVELSFPDV